MRDETQKAIQQYEAAHDLLLKVDNQNKPYGVWGRMLMVAHLIRPFVYLVGDIADSLHTLANSQVPNRF